MKIGLWSDSHNFPSLPLMKLSTHTAVGITNIKEKRGEDMKHLGDITKINGAEWQS